MTKLVFIGGAPGVGKSRIASELLGRLDHCVWLDRDDLWRMHPFLVNDTTKNMVEHNIQFVLRSFVQTGFSVVTTLATIQIAFGVTLRRRHSERIPHGSIV
jgi:predicted ABC-type ATPase